MPGAAPPSGGSTAPDPQVSRARWALMTLFVLFGLTQMSWLSRLPSVREALGVTSAELGTYLVVGALGALTAVASAGAVITRFGARTTLAVATGANLVGSGLLASGVALGHSPLFLAGLLVNGMSGALINTPINLSAALVEQRAGRSILPQFHAGFSIGAATGALVAAGFAAAQIHVAAQIGIVIVVVTVARILLLRPATALAAGPAGQTSASGLGMTPADGLAGGPARAATSARSGRSAGSARSARPRGAALRTALGAWREPRTLLIGLVLLAGALSEGSAGNWLAIAVVDGFGAREALGAVAYGTFVGSMTVVRLGGTRLLDRFGRVGMLRASGVFALAGLGLFGLSPSLAWAWAGIVLWGAGSALASPVAVAAASDEPMRAAARVSVATSFSSLAQICAPPLLGLLADDVGARHALLVICAAMVLSLAVAGQVRQLPTAAFSRPAPDGSAVGLTADLATAGGAQA